MRAADARALRAAPSRHGPLPRGAPAKRADAVPKARGRRRGTAGSRAQARAPGDRDRAGEVGIDVIDDAILHPVAGFGAVIYLTPHPRQGSARGAWVDPRSRCAARLDFSGDFRRGDRKPDDDTRTLPLVVAVGALDPQRPAMSQRDLLHDCEPEARAVAGRALNAIEPFEHSAMGRFRYPRPVVFDAEVRIT